MFVGREYYLERLEALWRKSVASLVVISGRRRIGKSTLVEVFAESSKCSFIEIEGLAPDKYMTNEKQIENFCASLARATGSPEVKADSWPKAFDALNAALGGRDRKIVFLDEISWMGGYDTSFAAYLKNAWDMQFIFDGIDVLSVTGGVPKYLQEIDPSLPADENVKRMCFTPEGYLFKDFNTIFGDVFGAAAAKRRILLALANGSASVSELAEKFEREPNGHLSEDLRDLTAAGFVASSAGKNPETGSDVREVRYRLRDNYTRFHLKFIAPKAEAIGEGLFRFTTLDRLPGWESIMGLQFENLVLNNLKKLCSLIGLDGRLVTSAAPYVRRPGKTTPGVQIDLLVQTPKSVYLVEIKRRARISSAIEDEVQEKVRRLRVPRGTSVRTVLVYDGTIAPEVEENGYFDYLVPLESFFN